MWVGVRRGGREPGSACALAWASGDCYAAEPQSFHLRRLSAEQEGPPTTGVAAPGASLTVQPAPCRQLSPSQVTAGGFSEGCCLRSCFSAHLGEAVHGSLGLGSAFLFPPPSLCFLSIPPAQQISDCSVPEFDLSFHTAGELRATCCVS